jgi:hypothetical protein
VAPQRLALLLGIGGVSLAVAGVGAALARPRDGRTR